MRLWLREREAVGPIWQQNAAFRRAPSRRPGVVGWRLLALAAVPLAAVLATWLDPLPADIAGQARAVDGDSLLLAGNRIRLVGVDAPEADQHCWDAAGATWACGREAHRRLVGLVARTETVCRPAGKDRYGRILAACEAGGRDLARTMVVEGMALARPNHAAEQSAAREAGRGIWAGRFSEPRQWRDQGPSEEPVPDIWEAVWNWLRELTGARALR
jgi:endonuclease YncB( thermonuclease family)